MEVALSVTDLRSAEATLAAIKKEVDVRGGPGVFSLVVISHITSVPVSDDPLPPPINFVFG